MLKTFIILLILNSTSIAFAGEVESEILIEADKYKTLNPKKSLSLLNKLDKSFLSPLEEDTFNYLFAYNLYINGKSGAAKELLEAIVSHTQNNKLKFRSLGTLLSIYATTDNWSNALDAAKTLHASVNTKPDLDIETTEKINFSLLNFYNNIGEYELAKRIATELLDTAKSQKLRCQTSNELMRSYVVTTPKNITQGDLLRAKRECESLNDPIHENISNGYMAEYFLVTDRPNEAIRLLESNIVNVKSTQYQALIAGFYELMAEGYLAIDEYSKAERIAKVILETREQHQYEKTVTTAYKVLAEVAEHSEQFEQAFYYYKRYSKAKQLNLDQDNAKFLAIQKAEFEAAEQKVKITLLDKENALLKTQALLDSESAQNRRLALALLSMALVVFVLWTYKNRRNYLKLQKYAQVDELTGIANRHYFTQQANTVINYCRRTNQPVSFIIFDLDYFKRINDTYGHQTGDIALKIAVNAAKLACRKNDIIGRLGGEEFGILLPGCASHLAAFIAEKCRKAIEQANFMSSGYDDLKVTASFGISDSGSCEYNFEKLFAGADFALYQSKDLGRNRVVQYQPETVAFDI